MGMEMTACVLDVAPPLEKMQCLLLLIEGYIAKITGFGKYFPQSILTLITIGNISDTNIHALLKKKFTVI